MNGISRLKRRVRTAGSARAVQPYRCTPAQCCADLPPPCLQALVQQHLDACARLRLFQASKGLAALVLQHAACCTLTLQAPERHRGQIPPGVALAVDVRKAALQGIMLAGSTMSLKVVLQGGYTSGCALFPLWHSLPLSQITYLTLKTLKLSNDVLRGLQLHQCSRLQHLRMAECVWAYDTCKPNCWDVARHMAQNMARLMAEQWQEWLPPSLKRIAAGMFIYADAVLTIQPFLTENVTTFSAWLLEDQLLDMLAELPHLTHVTFTEVADITIDYSEKRWPWQQLQFLRGCSLRNLEKLPLQHIPQIRMHGMPSCSRDMTAEAISQAVARLAAHPGFQIVPKTLEGLDVPYLCTTKADPPELVQLCLAKVITRPCALYLQGHYGLSFNLGMASTRDYLVSQLQQLPDHVTAVVFYTVDYNRYPSSWGNCKELWKPILAALPKHVTQIVLHMKEMPSVSDAERLVTAMTGHKPCPTVKLMVSCTDTR